MAVRALLLVAGLAVLVAGLEASPQRPDFTDADQADNQRPYGSKYNAHPGKVAGNKRHNTQRDCSVECVMQGLDKDRHSVVTVTQPRPHVFASEACLLPERL